MKNLLICLFLLALLTAPVSAQESLFFQTDRPCYASGETLYFKLDVLDAATRKPSRLSQMAYLVLRAPNAEPVLQLRVKVSAGIAVGSLVLPDSLHSDAYQFVAFTALQRNVGESAFQHREILVVNRLDRTPDVRMTASTDTLHALHSDSLLWLQTDKADYAPGESVQLHLGSVFDRANLTVSVFEEPSGLALDNQRAETMPNSTSQTYLPEHPWKILRGRVVDNRTGQVVPDAIVLLSRPDSVANLQYAVTDSDGLFQLQLNPYYDGRELFLSIKEMPSDHDWKITVEDPFFLAERWRPKLQHAPASLNAFLDKSRDIALVNKVYAPRDVSAKRTDSPAPVCPVLYRRPVKPVFPSEFVSLDSFPEIAVELLPSVKWSRQDGICHLRTVTREQELYGRNDASVFLDGVYLDNVNALTPLASEDIRKIEVLEDKRALGNIVFYGILSVQTTSNTLLRTKPGPQSLRLRNDSVALGNAAYDQRPPSTEQKRTPYYKQLLYWNPTATAPSDLEFFTSENTGRFLIRVEGFSPDGRPLCALARIQVINPKKPSDQ